MLAARDIMTQEVITIAPEASVEDLARLLEERRISGVPVLEADGRIVGVVTQSDLIQRSRDLELPPALNILDLHLFLETPSRFKKRLEKLLGDKVQDVMTGNPVTIAPDTPVKEIAHLMDTKGVHTLPVLEGGKLVGIVGKLDLIRALARPRLGVTRIRRLSRSPADTRALAAHLGLSLAPGDVVALLGELGAGKTEFVRGLAQGLGVPEQEVASPSFALAYEYQGRLILVHLDLYRLTKIPPDFLPDLEDYLAGPHVVAVEWAERLGELLPPEYVEVLLVIIGEQEREITLTGHGPRGQELILQVREGVGASGP